jgi:hypothetical protein
MTVIVFKNFLDKDVCQELNDWVELGVKNKWLDLSVSDWISEKRKTTRMYSDRFEYPKVAYDVFEKITNKLSLTDLAKSVAGGGKDGMVVSYTTDGGSTYEHLDRKEGSLEVLRCNILTSKPTGGGELFVDNKKVELNQGDLHCYLPSVVKHYATETKGDVSRILWMFGYQISEEQWQKKVEEFYVCQ